MPESASLATRKWVGLARETDSGIEIEGALGPWSGEHEMALVLLVGKDGAPIEWLSLAPDDLSFEGVRANRTSEAEDHGDEVPELPQGDLSVAVCTRDRADSLRDCLKRLRTATGDRYEVLVIDNASKTDSTRKVVDEAATSGMNVRYHLEKRPGLSRARNAALNASSTRYVAFTDDDARPDLNWAREVHRGFGFGKKVAVVTGIVPPAQIETASQALFESKIKWSSTLVPETYSMAKKDEYPWPFPYAAGHFGAGANLSVDREIVGELGGFDEALGAGTRTEGGEDLEIFVRVLRRGFELRFQPSAIVWHIHRREEEDLRKQLFGYGKGLSAAVFAEFLDPGKLEMIKGTLRGALNLAKHRQGELDYGMPRSHLALEVMGLLYGPIAYVVERSRGPK